MPPEHGRRLTALLPDARLVELDDTYTLIPLDQPATLADAIRSFVDAPTPADTGPAQRQRAPSQRRPLRPARHRLSAA